ncbi:MAG: LysR family transcriptional regulator [Bacteroidota bacterium]
MYYTLHQLQIFHKVVETKSITKAAEELHLTQPAVSIQLRKLQDQFEIPLTEVIGRKLYITDFGLEIAQASERILNEADAIKYKTLAYKGHVVGRLRISVVSTGKYVMPYFLSNFLKEYEGVDLIMDVTNKSRVVESLEKNEVDFALVSVLPDNLQIEREELMQNKLFLVGNEPLSGKAKQHQPQVMEKIPLIFRERGSATRQAMERFIVESKLPINKKMELTSNEAVKQAVLAGLGYSIMPLIGIKNELNSKDLQIIPIKGLPISTSWNLIWLKNKKLSPVGEAYLSHLKDQKSLLIKEKFDWYEAY